MKIKEILFDYTSPIDIPTKNLAKDAETIITNYKKALQDKTVKPYDIDKRYRDYFKSINVCFKDCVLHNKKSKTGIFVSQHKKYSIDTAAKEYFDFTVSRNNLQMDYAFDKLYKMTLVEVSILLLTYEKIYDFQLKYAIIYLMRNRFKYYSIDWEGNHTVLPFLYGRDDIEQVYNWVLNVETTDLPKIANEHVIKFHSQNAERLTPKSVMEPRNREDLECLIKECTSQTEKKQVIANHFHISMSTAQRIMKKFGLLNKSFKEIHDERSVREHEEIKTHSTNQHGETNEVISEQAKTIIDSLTQQLNAMSKQIDKLSDEVKSLKDENSKLKMSQGIFQANSNKEDFSDIDFLYKNITLTR